jgi:hypothetical protein
MPDAANIALTSDTQATHCFDMLLSLMMIWHDYRPGPMPCLFAAAHIIKIRAWPEGVVRLSFSLPWIAL